MSTASNKEIVKGTYEWNKVFNSPNPALRAYFGRVRAGNPEEYRTPFGGKVSPTEILNQWMPTLEKKLKGMPGLLKFEKDLASKVGPMSIQKPLSERMEDIDSYYDSILLESEPISESAINAVISEWSPAHGITLRGRDKTIQKMKLSTNSGSPYFVKPRRAVLKKTIDRFSRVNAEPKFPLAVYSGNAKDWELAAVLGWRGQEGGPSKENVKQRVVWMFPFVLNIEELRCYQPIIEAAQKHRLVPAWVSLEEVDKRITTMFDTKGPDDLVICTDFEKFDQHFNQHMQTACHQILDAILETGNADSQYWLKHVFPIKYYIPLAYDEERIRVGHHGMASGSGGTNCDETLTHRALQYEAAQNKGVELNPNSQCLGDDGVLTFPGITVEDVTSVYQKHGQVMNKIKQSADAHECTYLRRWHSDSYRINGICAGVYSTCRALGRLCEQERWYDNWSAEMVALRQLSIMENCKNHPLREEFADFCMKRDKYRLGLDLPGFLDNLVKLSKEAIDDIPDFLGYSRSLSEDVPSSINSWWIVNYLKSKA